MALFEPFPNYIWNLSVAIAMSMRYSEWVDDDEESPTEAHRH